VLKIYSLFFKLFFFIVLSHWKSQIPNSNISDIFAFYLDNTIKDFTKVYAER